MASQVLPLTSHKVSLCDNLVASKQASHAIASPTVAYDKKRKKRYKSEAMQHFVSQFPSESASLEAKTTKTLK